MPFFVAILVIITYQQQYNHHCRYHIAIVTIKSSFIMQTNTTAQLAKRPHIQVNAATHQGAVHLEPLVQQNQHHRALTLVQ
jgi:hypothetical protein